MHQRFSRFSAFSTIVLMLLAIPVAGDVIYLHNGSVIKGRIVDYTPDSAYKIETADGSIFVFEAGQVQRVEYSPDSLSPTPRTALRGRPAADRAVASLSWG